MPAIQGLFESHLTVSDLERSMAFYRDRLGLPLARIFPERRVAFFWIGAKGKAMLGLWETGSTPQRMSLHVAFESSLETVLDSPRTLQQSGIAPLDFDGNSTREPVVLCWMPAASIFFHDPDGNLLELLAMLPDEPQPERGVIPWSAWSPPRSSAGS